MTYQPGIATLSRTTLSRRGFIVASLTAAGGMMLGLRHAGAANEPVEVGALDSSSIRATASPFAFRRR